MVYDPTFDPDEEFEGAERKGAPLLGGHYELGRKKYYFPGDLYVQVQEADSKTPFTRAGDKKFAKWLGQFIAENEDRVTEVPKSQRSEHYGAGSGLSGYWAMGGYYNKASSGVSEVTAKLATVLRAMRTVMSVVDPHHKLTVKYTDGETSSWMNNQVNIPKAPVEQITDLEEAINVESGFGIHEAFHSKFTRPLFLGQTWFKEFLKKSNWNQYIWNVVEDVREEGLGLKETPGFREYLGYTMEFLWNEGKMPASWEWGDDKLEERSKAYYMFLREQDRADELLTDPSFAEPRAWFNDWTQRYVDGLNANTTPELAKALIEEAREYLQIPEGAGEPPKTLMILTPCGYLEGDEGLDSGEEDKIADAIEAEVEIVDAKSWNSIFGEPPKDAKTVNDWYSGDVMEKCVISKPRVTNPGLFKASTGGLVEKAKAALSLRKAVPQADTRLMKSGQLDEDELYRFMQNDMRFFKDATVDTVPDAAVYLLVDMSGSMGSAAHETNSAYYATRIAQIFVEGLAAHQNVKVKVLGHTGDNEDCNPGGAFYRIWEQGDPLNRLSILYEEHRMGDNFDSWAIAWAGQLIKQETVDQRLLIVLSDGQPSGEGYGGSAAMEHVRSVTDRLMRQGVDVVQVAVGKGIPAEHQAQMFKHFIELRDDRGGDPFASVFRKLTKLLQKFV